jgi:hypothetical protein
MWQALVTNNQSGGTRSWLLKWTWSTPLESLLRGSLQFTVHMVQGAPLYDFCRLSYHVTVINLPAGCRSMWWYWLYLLVVGACDRIHFTCWLSYHATVMILPAGCRSMWYNSFYLLVVGVCDRIHFTCWFSEYVLEFILPGGCRSMWKNLFYMLVVGVCDRINLTAGCRSMWQNPFYILVVLPCEVMILSPVVGACDDIDFTCWLSEHVTEFILPAGCLTLWR